MLALPWTDNETWRVFTQGTSTVDSWIDFLRWDFEILCTTIIARTLERYPQMYEKLYAEMAILLRIFNMAPVFQESATSLAQYDCK